MLVLNATFNNISAISWQSVLVVEEDGVPSENHLLLSVIITFCIFYKDFITATNLSNSYSTNMLTVKVIRSLGYALVGSFHVYKEESCTLLSYIEAPFPKKAMQFDAILNS